VQAVKSLQIYKAPLVLVINLKRFKHGRRQAYSYGYGMGGGNGKLSTLVEFPIEGLDLKPYILDKSEDGKTYVYDLFGISNHFGGLGGGHYTAYAKNWKEDQWYSYDDSSCSRTSASRIVTDAAYNLFYRLRGSVDLSNINYSSLKQSATLESLEAFKK
jgi:ubiquitin carboxyl-terminal hydrolase 4/11/15